MLKSIAATNSSNRKQTKARLAALNAAPEVQAESRTAGLTEISRALQAGQLERTCAERDLPAANLNPGLKQRATPPTKRPDRKRPARSNQACGAPGHPCPSCGQPISDAAQAVRDHERLLKWLFQRQEEFELSLASAIYDGLAQRLAGALLHLQGALHPQKHSATNGAQQSFQFGLKLLQDSIQEAGQIAGRLRPPICAEHEMTLGMGYLIQEARSLGRTEIVFQVRGEVGRLPPDLGGAVFRIVRELLSNACRHSGSEVVRLEVVRMKDCLRLKVEDWGTGFDLTNPNGQAFGLQEVRQRARLLGGRVTVESAPGKGTRVVVTLPVDDMPCAEVQDRTAGRQAHRGPAHLTREEQQHDGSTHPHGMEQHSSWDEGWSQAQLEDEQEEKG